MNELIENRADFMIFQKAKKYILGIDLGTYNSTAAVVAIESSGMASEPRIIRSIRAEKDRSGFHNEFEKLKSFPSFVSYRIDGSVDKVGLEAKKLLIKDPQHVVWGVKRLLGKTYTEAKDQGELDRFSYTIEPDPETGKCLIVVGARRYKPEDVSSEIIKEIKKEAEKEIAYLFSWDDIPGNDSYRLTGFLHQKYSIDWVKIAKIEKIDNGRIIKVYSEKNILSLSLNDEETKVSLKIDDCRTDEFIGIKENRKLNIFEKDVFFSDVIISVPAYFDALHVTPIVQAAQESFKSVKTIPEPVAASIAYNVLISPKPLRVLAFDLGAGTLDVTVGNLIRKGPNPSDVTFQIKITTGNTHLGGVDMDDRIERLLREKSDLKSADLSSSDDVKIRREAEKAKIRLSKEPKIPVAFQVNNNKYSFDVDRFELEMALRGNKGEMDIIDECRRQVIEAIKGAYWNPEDIEQILLIGGPSCMPSILQMLKEVFHKNPKILKQIEQIESGKLPVDPMEAVAKGAALSSGIRKIIPHPYGYGFLDLKFEPRYIIEVPNVLIPRGSAYPCMSEPYTIAWYRKAATTEIEIIQQVPETENPEYRHLGFVGIAIKELGESPIEITMGLNDNGELVIKLYDTLYGKEVQYIGISHFRRIPITLPRPREKPLADIEKTSHDDLEVDETVLQELINWAQAVLKLCNVRMGDIDPAIAKDIRPSINKLNDTFSFHVWDRKEKGKHDLKSAKEYWNDILNGSNQLLHIAAERGIIEKKETDERKRQGKDIENRLLKKKEKI